MCKIEISRISELSQNISGLPWKSMDSLLFYHFSTFLCSRNSDRIAWRLRPPHMTRRGCVSFIARDPCLATWTLRNRNHLSSEVHVCQKTIPVLSIWSIWSRKSMFRLPSPSSNIRSIDAFSEGFCLCGLWKFSRFLVAVDFLQGWVLGTKQWKDQQLQGTQDIQQDKVLQWEPSKNGRLWKLRSSASWQFLHPEEYAAKFEIKQTRRMAIVIHCEIGVSTNFKDAIRIGRNLWIRQWPTFLILIDSYSYCYPQIMYLW